MPWIRARLRGQLVYARADAAGALKVEGGRVEIRYKPSDGRRYDARADNLTIADPALLPDDTCASAEPVTRPAQPASKPAARGHVQVASHPAASVPLAAGAVHVYADGACSGNPGPAGLGVVIIDGPRRVELSEYLGEATNNIAELTAIQRALEEIAEGDRAVIIHTDSQYSIGVLQKGWKAKANADLVSDVRADLASRSRTRLVYVPGHAGVPLNERADELAREAVRARRSRRAEFPPPT